MNDPISEKSLAIINGKDPAGKCEQYIKLLHTVGVETIFTQYKGHATELARNSGDYSNIIVVGGDGTFYEIINGINRSRQTISIIPNGTVNCFANFLGIRNIHDWLNILNSGVYEKADLLALEIFPVTGEPYTRYIWGFLAFGHVVNITELAQKFGFLLKPFRYILSTMINNFVWRKVKATIIVNHEEPLSKTFTSLIVNNATASHFTSIPYWNMQDGEAELQVLNLNPLVQFIRSFGRFIKLPFGLNWVNGIRTLLIEFEHPVSMMADGELFDNIQKISIKVLKQEISLLTPPGRKLDYRVRGFGGVGRYKFGK